MVFYLRKQGHDLSRIAEMIVDESQKGSKPCKDNCTLLIVSLSEYYQDFRQNFHRRCPGRSDLSNCSLDMKKSYSDHLNLSLHSFSSGNHQPAGASVQSGQSSYEHQSFSDVSSVHSSSERPQKLSLRQKLVEPFQPNLQNQNQISNDYLQLQCEETIIHMDD